MYCALPPNQTMSKYIFIQLWYPVWVLRYSNILTIKKEWSRRVDEDQCLHGLTVPFHTHFQEKQLCLGCGGSGKLCQVIHADIPEGLPVGLFRKDRVMAKNIGPESNYKNITATNRNVHEWRKVTVFFSFLSQWYTAKPYHGN